LVFEKNANFFAKIWQKSQKIVIITSTPDFIRGATPEMPSFSWHESEKSSDGIPVLRIHYPELHGEDQVALKIM
jgi:hypothetical protein